MNRQKLTELVNHPDKISQRDVALLSDMAEQYPYATVIRILLAKSKQQQADAREALATAALYTPNRQVLRQVMENTLPPLSYETETSSSFNATGPAEAEVINWNTGAPQAEKEEADEPAKQLGFEEKETGEANRLNSSASAAEQEINPSAGESSTPEDKQEEPPQSKSDIFDELQQNLKRLREERNKWQPSEKNTRQEKPADENQEDSGVGTGRSFKAHMTPAIQQVVEDHQKQPLDNPRVQEQRNLINSFLKNAESLQRRSPAASTQETENTDLSDYSNSTPLDLATETLAQIMERQGKTAKAIDIYEKLLLKFPQKSAYFASCIERLKKDL